MSSDESTRIIWLANHVVRQQQQNAVISLFSLAAVFVAMHALTKPNSPPMHLQQLQQKVATLKKVVESLGALVDCTREWQKWNKLEPEANDNIKNFIEKWQLIYLRYKFWLHVSYFGKNWIKLKKTNSQCLL